MRNRHLCYSYGDYDFEVQCFTWDRSIHGIDMFIIQSKVLESRTNGGAYQICGESICGWKVKFKPKQK